MSRYLLLPIMACALILGACSPLQATPEPPALDQPPLILEPGASLDENDLLRGEVYIYESQLFIMESYPVQVAVAIKGELPTPCHQLVVNVTEPDDQNQIFIDVYAGYRLGEDCIQVLEPFEENISIPMSGQPDGTYMVWINGELVGEFSYPA